MPGKKRLRRLWPLLALALTLGLAAAAYFAPRLVYSSFGYLWLRPQDGDLDQAAMAELNQKTDGLKCRVVWSSSRSGNHELYMLRLPVGEIIRLTDNDHVDFFPRFSPDGKRLVFARSQKQWVSERDYNQWDVWLMDLNTGEQTMLARAGNFPLWVDEDVVSFMRGNKVVVKSVGTGTERVIYDGDGPPVGGVIVTPMLSPAQANLLALTARGAARGCLVFDPRTPDKAVNFGDGCKLIFTPDGKGLIWVENGGNGGNRLMTSPVGRVAPTVFMDLPGDFSHEYFPKLSADGRWLVWAASAGGHEHDIADYEIFIWNTSKSWDQAARLTYNEANDRWPDIFLD